MSTDRPWYAFAFRVLGPHGAFLAAVISGLGALFTAHDAFLWAMNREPTRVEVEETAEPGALRWIEVRGLELRLNPRLVPSRPGSEEGRPEDLEVFRTVLLDRASIEANRWAALRRRVFADLARAAGDPAVASTVYPDLAETALELDPSVNGRDETEDEEEGLAAYLPGRALILIGTSDRTGRLDGPDPFASAEEADGPETWREPEELDSVAPAVVRQVHEWARDLGQYVRPRRGYAGTLEPVPAEVRAHFRAAYGIDPGRWGLLVGGRPAATGAWMFGVFLGVLGIVGVGYVGVWRAAPEVEDEAVARAAAPETGDDEA